MRLRAALCSLVLLSCARVAPSTNPSPADLDANLPPYGDAIDDAAWEALGPRPTDSPRLRYAPIRLQDFVMLDKEERSGREFMALKSTELANEALQAHLESPLDMYLDAIRVAPSFLPPWFPAVAILLNRGELQRAHALAQQYVRIALPGDGLPLFILGKCQAHVGQTQQAMQSFERALHAPLHSQTDAAAAMALIHIQQNNLHAAESLQAVYDIQDEVITLLLRAKEAQSRGDLDEAAQAFEATLALASPPTGVWEELAAVHLELGDFAAARDAYERALQETPQRAGPSIGLARIDIAEGRYAEAGERLQRIVEQEPDNLAAQFNLAVTVLERARAGDKMTENAMRRAQQAWTHCIQGDFATESALWGRAEICLLRGDLSAASFDAQQLHEFTSDIPAAQVRWARLLLVNGYEREALEALREASRHGELDRDGRALLARLEDKAGTDALDLLRDAFAENPQDAATGARLGVALLVDGELEEAERVLRAVVALRPEDPNALQNLAAVLDRRRKYREAQALLIKAESLR